MKRKKNLGLLVAFEGISGCGKSESIKKVYKQLVSDGYNTKVIDWNSNKTIRKLAGKFDAVGMLNSSTYCLLQWCSFLVDYYFKIRPLLRKGYVVLADRYVYTGVVRDLTNNAGKVLGKIICRLVRHPDLVFFYDVAPGICYERIKKREKRLFHTNALILQSKHLKNKELYYLKKMRHKYRAILDDGVLCNCKSIITVDNNDFFQGMDMDVYMKPIWKLIKEDALAEVTLAK